MFKNQMRAFMERKINMAEGKYMSSNKRCGNKIIINHAIMYYEIMGRDLGSHNLNNIITLLRIYKLYSYKKLNSQVT